MSIQSRNLQFLMKCKKIEQQNSNNICSLIIPDRQITNNTLLSYQQIMVSQYASAIKDQHIDPIDFKPGTHYPIPIYFAFIKKCFKQKDLKLCTQIVKGCIKQHPSCSNRHILLFIKIRLLVMQKSIREASFYCQSLLKQAGDGSDYYTYQFLRLLIEQGRYEECYKIAERHMDNAKISSQQKCKIQSIYIWLLSLNHQKIQGSQWYQSICKKLEKYFHNRNICLRNYFNLALLIKNKAPQKSLQMFQKLIEHTSSISSRLNILVKINIIDIYEKYYIPYPEKLVSHEFKEILEESLKYYDQVVAFAQVNEQYAIKYKELAKKLHETNQLIKSQSNMIFFQSINQKTKGKKYITNNGFSQVQNQEVISEATPKKTKNDKMKMQQKYFHQKRAQNQRRLKFLLKKQKQLKNFFEKLKIEKNGSKLNIKILDKSLIDKGSKNNYTQQIQIQEARFQERKKKYKIIYQQGEINSIISNFIDERIMPYQRSKLKIKNIENIKRFIKDLQCPTQQNEPVLASCTSRDAFKSNKNTNPNSRACTQNSFRVKNNSSRRNSEKVFEGLKNNDYISNKILHNLKNNIAEKKKQQKPGVEKTFKQLLKQGQQLDSQNKLQQVHQLYAQMYKRFKQDKQKQIILLKIAQNFQKLSFISEAEKTYIKCTKFNNTEAFFRLGSLQIRNGNIELGIQNLEKANCIDRYNLVYAYSLLQSTTQRALALANSILKRNPQCIQALIMSSKILQKKGKLQQALDIALIIGSNYPSPSTYHYIGLLYLNDSNVSQAFKYFHKAIEIQPNHHPSLIQVATIISEQKPLEAIQILKNVLSLDPKNQLAFARLGKIYETHENDYQNALLVYKKGLQHAPSYQNYIKIGDCQLKQNCIVDAYLSYKQALALKKTSQIYQKIAQIHQIQHQDKKAIEIYMNALTELPKDNSQFLKKKKYLYKLGKLSLTNQQFDVAYNYLCEVADMQQNGQVFKLLGQACFGKGDYNQALQYYEKASSFQNQDNLELLQNIAMCLDKQQEYLTSKTIYEKILSIDPKNTKCLNNLANILLILGKTNEAFYWFQYMLQQVPTSIDKRLRVADIYATIGDWSKVEQHLMICYKQKESDQRVLERMVNLYKEKRDTKQLNKFQKRLALIKNNSKNA